MTFKEERRVREVFRDISTAPKDGTHVRLKLKDAYGTYPFEPCQFIRGKWRKANGTQCILVNEAIGWLPLRKKRCGYE